LKPKRHMNAARGRSALKLEGKGIAKKHADRLREKTIDAICTTRHGTCDVSSRC